MKLEADAKMNFGRDLVFETYRDRLPELCPYLPDIKAITVQERSDEGSTTKILNLWEASTEIPAIAEKIIKPEMLAWLDHATWDADARTVDWRIETKMFTENVKCWGKNTVREDGDGCIFEIRGELEVSLKGIPGVPRFLAGKVAPHVEKFVVQLMTPNLLAVANGVERYLADQADKQPQRSLRCGSACGGRASSMRRGTSSPGCSRPRTPTRAAGRSRTRSVSSRRSPRSGRRSSTRPIPSCFAKVSSPSRSRSRRG